MVGRCTDNGPWIWDISWCTRVRATHLPAHPMCTRGKANSIHSHVANWAACYLDPECWEMCRVLWGILPNSLCHNIQHTAWMISDIIAVSLFWSWLVMVGMRCPLVTVPSRVSLEVVTVSCGPCAETWEWTLVLLLGFGQLYPLPWLWRVSQEWLRWSLLTCLQKRAPSYGSMVSWLQDRTLKVHCLRSASMSQPQGHRLTASTQPLTQRSVQGCQPSYSHASPKLGLPVSSCCLLNRDHFAHWRWQPYCTTLIKQVLSNKLMPIMLG